MEAATPILSPRQELFCRYAAFGHTLAEAYRRARAELASELVAERAAEPVLSGTNHDHCAGPDAPPAASGATVPPARPGLSGPFHDISGEPDDIDVVIARINGTPVPRRAGTGHDEP